MDDHTAEFRTIIEAKNHELKLIYAERDALLGDKDEYYRQAVGTQTDLGKAYADDCAAMAPYIRFDAPKHVKEIALGWTEDDEREAP